MTDQALQAKAQTINAIIGRMRTLAAEADRAFDAGTLFFTLAGLSPSQLRRIAQACNA